MNHKLVIKETEKFARQCSEGYDSGHDRWHIDRVRNLALSINANEHIADPFALEIAALLHDTVDSKFTSGMTGDAGQKVENFLETQGISSLKEKVLNVIRNVSFSNKMKSGDLQMPELLIIQDADKLDAMGAIGIARAFNYGGFRNNSIFIPDKRKLQNGPGDGASTVAHFYGKLLLLKDMMNTPTGRRIAEERHNILERFLEQFFEEWNFGESD